MIEVKTTMKKKIGTKRIGVFDSFESALILSLHRSARCNSLSRADVDGNPSLAHRQVSGSIYGLEEDIHHPSRAGIGHVLLIAAGRQSEEFSSKQSGTTCRS